MIFYKGYRINVWKTQGGSFKADVTKRIGAKVYFKTRAFSGKQGVIRSAMEWIDKSHEL